MSTYWQLGVDIGSVHVKVAAIDPQGGQYFWVRPARGRPFNAFAELFTAEIRKSIGNAHVCLAVRLEIRRIGYPSLADC